MPTSVRKSKNVNNPPTISKILQNRDKRVRFILLLCGMVLIAGGIVFAKLADLKQTKPQKQNTSQSTDKVVSFSQEPVLIDKGFLTKSIKKEKDKLPPTRILIPDLQIDLPVKEAKVVKGYWEVFPDVAGFGLGSAYPDEVGNQVIFAHAREGLFLPLKKAKVGQIIYVFTKEKWFSYKISDVKEVLPSQTEVIAPTKETILTLYTCSGFADSKRLIVKAERI